MYQVARKFKRADEILMCMGYSPGKTSKKGDEDIVEHLVYGGGSVITQQVVDTAVDLVVLHCELELMKQTLARDSHGRIYDALHQRSLDSSSSSSSSSSHAPPHQPLPHRHDAHPHMRPRATPVANAPAPLIADLKSNKEFKQRAHQESPPIVLPKHRPNVSNQEAVGPLMLPNRSAMPQPNSPGRLEKSPPPTVQPRNVKERNVATKSPIYPSAQQQQQLVPELKVRLNEKQPHDKHAYKEPQRGHLATPQPHGRRASDSTLGSVEPVNYHRSHSSDNYIDRNPSYPQQRASPEKKLAMIPHVGVKYNNLGVPPEQSPPPHPTVKSANFPRGSERTPMPLPQKSLPPNPDDLPRPVVNRMELEMMHTNTCDTYSTHSSPYMPSFQDARSVYDQRPSGPQLESLLDSSPLSTMTPSPGDPCTINELWKPRPDDKPSSIERKSDSSEDLYNSGSNSASAPGSLETPGFPLDGSPSTQLRGGQESSRYETRSPLPVSPKPVAQFELRRYPLRPVLEKHHSYENEAVFIEEYVKAYGEESYAAGREQYMKSAKPTAAGDATDRDCENDTTLTSSTHDYVNDGHLPTNPDPDYVNHSDIPPRNDLSSHGYLNVCREEPGIESGEGVYATVTLDQRMPTVAEHGYRNVKSKPATKRGEANLPHQTRAPPPTSDSQESDLDSKKRPQARQHTDPVNKGYANCDYRPPSERPVQSDRASYPGTQGSHIAPPPPPKPGAPQQQQWGGEQAQYHPARTGDSQTAPVPLPRSVNTRMPPVPPARTRDPHQRQLGEQSQYLPARTGQGADSQQHEQQQQQQQQQQGVGRRFPNEVRPHMMSPARSPPQHPALKASEAGPTKREYVNYKPGNEDRITDNAPASSTGHYSVRNDMNYDAAAPPTVKSSEVPPRDIKRVDRETVKLKQHKEPIAFPLAKPDVSTGQTYRVLHSQEVQPQEQMVGANLKDQPNLFKGLQPSKLPSTVPTRDGWTCANCTNLEFDMTKYKCEVCNAVRKVISN